MKYVQLKRNFFRKKTNGDTVRRFLVRINQYMLKKNIENVFLDIVKSVKVNRNVNDNFQAKIKNIKKVKPLPLYSFFQTKRPIFMRLYHKNLYELFKLLRKNYKYGRKRHCKACKTKQLHLIFSENTSFYYLNDHYVNFKAILPCC